MVTSVGGVLSTIRLTDRMQQSDVYRPGESCQKLRQEEGLYGLVDLIY